MPTRQPYTECRLYYDAPYRKVDVGDYLLTRAGSGYLVTSMRRDKKNPYRKHLICLRWPGDEIPADATVHPLQWYARKKRAGVRLRA